MSGGPGGGSKSRLLILAVSAVAIFGTLTRCALDPTVTVYPIFLTPSENRPFTNLVDMVEARDYQAAITRRWTVLQKEKPTSRELAALGHLEMASGLTDLARVHLTDSLDSATSRERIASISWDLSQAEFLAGRYDESRRWAENAVRNGLQVSRWHLDLLESLSGIQLQTMVEGGSGELPMITVDATIPRVMAAVNDAEPVAAVIDSGAVFTIMSRSLAESSGIKILGRSGKLLGLLNEPIMVEFGVIQNLEIGRLRVTDLLVAVMPDEDLRFLVRGSRPYQMDLLLGTNLLRHLRLDLDFPRRLVSLDLSRASEPSPTQNLFFVDFRPMVQVSINRRGWFLFLLDTGSEITYLNQSTIEATTARNREQLHGAILQGLGGSKKRGAQLLGVELATSGWGGSFKAIPTYANPGSPAFGIIGQNFLSQFRVMIDFGRMRLDLLQ